MQLMTERLELPRLDFTEISLGNFSPSSRIVRAATARVIIRHGYRLNAIRLTVISPELNRANPREPLKHCCL